MKQDSDSLWYRSFKPSSVESTTLPTPPISNATTQRGTPDDDDTEALIHHYFNLEYNLSDLYEQWAASDPNFKKKAVQFAGIRIMRQDAWETLVSFICSSNNNIARISQMVSPRLILYSTNSRSKPWLNRWKSCVSTMARLLANWVTRNIMISRNLQP